MNIELWHLSQSFRTDAAHLIVKVHYANNPNAPYLRTSYIAKLVVDVYMACECALKSMISSSRGEENAVIVYAEILKCGHDLKRLLRCANAKGLLGDNHLHILRRAAKMGVKIRYSLDLFSLTATDLIPKTEVDEVSFRVDQDYLAKFLVVAEALLAEADNRHVYAFGGEGLLLSSERMRDFVKRLRSLTRAQRKACGGGVVKFVGLCA